MSKPVREDVYVTVKQVLTDLLSAKNQKDSARQPKLEWTTDIYDDLGLDSLELLDLLTGLEEAFQVNPDQYEANDKRTVAQIVDYTMLLLEKKSYGASR